MSTRKNASQVEGQYQKWQEVKIHQREKEHNLLQQKIILQHKLIAAVDVRSHQRHQELIKRQTIERGAQRQEKKQRDDKLVQKGKESIARGLKSQAASQQKTAVSAKSTDDISSSDDGIRLSLERLRRLSAIPSRVEEEEMSRSASMMSAGGDTIKSNGKEEFRPVEEVQGWDRLPPHKQELYRLFGARDAECFLHPKILPEKTQAIQVPNRLRVEGGREGADTLWHLLRNKAHLKLEQIDSQIPTELKKAYSAYIREYLTHTKPASRKQFYTERDLPSNERVADSRYHEHIREIRHRTELMYRSSLANEDKTSILVHNNPMPDFNDFNGVDGIQRYHPSCSATEDQETLDAKSDNKLDYLKWLPPLGSSKQHRLEMRSQSSPGLQRTKPQIGEKERHHRSHRGQRLSFLTEEKARSPGQFWKNRRNPELPKPLIPGHMILAEVAEADVLIPGHMILAEGDVSDSRNLQDNNQEKVLLHQSRSQTADTTLRTKSWQPLALSAIEDHMPIVELLGSRDFRFGRPMTWKPIVANNSSSAT